MATNDFLRNYRERTLSQVCIPGSHDAGMDGGNTGLAPLYVTQTDGVGKQAEKGSRFFDVRIALTGGDLKAYHGPFDNMAFAKAGQRLLTVGQGLTATFGMLDELKNFVAANATEFIIIRLTHFAAPVATVLNEINLWAGIGNNGNYVHKTAGNLASQKVKHLAGRLIFVVEAKELNSAKLEFTSDPLPATKKGLFGKSYQPPRKKRACGATDGFHAFRKFKGTADAGGLYVCGEYSKSNDLAKITSGQKKKYDEHQHHNGIHLFCYYWTSTGGNIKQNTTELFPENLRKQMRGFVNRPNIVLYDFINVKMSKAIIALNEAMD